MPGRDAYLDGLLASAGRRIVAHDAGASRASRPSSQEHGSKQDRQGADADRDQDQLKERRDVHHTI